MNFREIRDMLPFYVANALTDEQKREVEKELERSKELRDALQFWKNAKRAMGKLDKYEAAGHLSHDDIIDYAESAIKDIQRKLAIEKHLQLCGNCRREFDVIKSTYPESIPAPILDRTLFERLIDALRSLRLVYAVPALAVAVVCIVIVSQQLMKDTTANRTTFILSYTIQERSGTDLPKLPLDKDVATIELSVDVPRGLPGTQYAVEVVRPSNDTVSIPDLVAPFASGPTRDSLRVSFSRSILGTRTGDFSLEVTERLGTSNDVMSYSIPFTVVEHEAR